MVGVVVRFGVGVIVGVVVRVRVGVGVGVRVRVHVRVGVGVRVDVRVRVVEEAGDSYCRFEEPVRAGHHYCHGVLGFHPPPGVPRLRQC